MNNINLNSMKLKMMLCGILISLVGSMLNAQTIKMKTDTLELDGPNGKLHTIITTPLIQNDNKGAMVIVMHGLMSSSEESLIQTMAEKLNKAGIATLRFDFNGHGKSGGNFIDMTVPKEIEDAKIIIDYVEKLNQYSSISLVGHSQGGVVTSMVAGELADKIDRIVLFAPAAVIYDEANAGTTLFTKYDPQNVPEYITTFNHHIGREWILAAQKLEIYQTAEKFEGPVSIIHGITDELVPYKYAEKYNDIYKNSELHLLENIDHSFSQDIDGVTSIAFDFLVNENK